jgi:cytochrome P450
MFKTLFTALRSARLDAELQEIIDEGNRTRQSASEIRQFLLKVLREDIDGVEKFNDAILEEAAELIDRLGPGAFYWMTDIAVQMTVLAQCSLRGIPTNIEADLGREATAEAIINSVVRI